MKQARSNSIVVLNKYEDMVDLNSVAEARQINLQFIVTTHMEL